MSNARRIPTGLIRKAVSVSVARLPQAIRETVVTKKQAGDISVGATKAFKGALGQIKRGR